MKLNKLREILAFEQRLKKQEKEMAYFSEILANLLMEFRSMQRDNSH